MAEVVSIHIVRTRHGEAEPLESAKVLGNYGLEGDWRSHRNRGGQLTLIEAEALEAIRQRLGYSVPPGASRRQVVVRGVRLNELIGRRVRLGAVRVFVETLCDPCSRMEATIGKGAQQCMEDCCGVRCHVLIGGDLCVGDPVLEEPFQSILSTPASSV